MSVERIEPNQAEILEIQEFVRSLLWVMFYGSCFILIVIPLKILFRLLLLIFMIITNRNIKM